MKALKIHKNLLASAVGAALAVGMVANASADILNYQIQQPSFPQESTGDQFFDEAQWESYRKLGVEIAERVFPKDSSSAYGEAFWTAVLVGGIMLMCQRMDRAVKRIRTATNTTDEAYAKTRAAQGKQLHLPE